MKKITNLMTLSICMSTLLAIVFCVSNVMLVMNTCPNCAFKCRKSETECYSKRPKKSEKCHPKRKFRRDARPDARRSSSESRRDTRPDARRPKFRISKEAQAQWKVLREAIAAYKKAPTPEGKAKIIEILGKNYDRRIAAMEKRAEAMNKNDETFKKKIAEMKAKRAERLEQMFEQMINPKKRPTRKIPHRGTKTPAAPAAK